MGEIKEIKSWICTDGKIFDNHNDAKDHQDVLNIVSLIGSSFGYAEDVVESIAKYICENIHEIGTTLGWEMH